MLRISIVLLLAISNLSLFSQSNTSIRINTNQYDTTLSQLDNLISENSNFKNAVLVSEIISKDNFFLSEINDLIIFCKAYNKSITNLNYRWRDSFNHKQNLSIKAILKDTVYIELDTLKFTHPPFRFNFTDPLGKKDITNTFVSKLLATHQGNCKSLTYLYKILADELGAKCWIALAPGHMYIKNYSEKIGWYNTELTSGTFPTDAYIMASSYINPTAVMSGMYMDTLSNQQAIALCVLDLAHLYERQTKNYYDGFILKCCDLVLKYHPVNPMALLLKAETLKKQAIREKSSKYPKLTATLKQMEQTYLKLFNLGYREMPYKMKKQKQKEEKENAKKYQPKINTP